MGAIGRAAPEFVRRWPAALVAIAIGLLMSTPVPADAAVLKRIHSGTTTISGSTPTTVTLELPDATKAFVVCSARVTNSGSSLRAGCFLSDNALKIDSWSNMGTNSIVVSWYVAEFESGVSVQRGTFTISFGQSTPPTPPTLNPPVDCSKSFVIMPDGVQGNYTGSSASSLDEAFTYRAILGTFAAPCSYTTPGTTTSTLSIARIETGGATNMVGAWQVVTMDGATVIGRGVTTIGASASTAIGGVGTPFNPATDFIVMSRAAGGSVAGVEAEYQVRVDSTSAFQLTFRRTTAPSQGNHHVDIAYEVVRLQDGGSVQRGSGSVTTATTMGAAGNLSVIDRSATIPFIWVSGGSGTTNTDLNDTSWTAEFPSTTQILLTRAGSSLSAGAANWFVVSFYKCANSRLCSMDVKGGESAATVSWSPIYDPQCKSGSTPTACQALVVRHTASITWTPTNGTGYTVGTQPSGSPAGTRVVFNGTGQTVADTGLTNGTRYYYRVYPRINGGNNYITDSPFTQTVNPMNEVSVTPSGNASLAWSYATTGGATLNAPIAGTGKVYVASNGNKMIALDSSTGLPIADPVIANGAIQSYLSWFPESGGTSEAVVAGDQNGWLTSVDAVTGDRVWTLQLPDPVTTGAGAPVQAAIAVQLNAYTRAPWQCDGGAFEAQYPTATQDLIYVAGRNSDRTRNQVWAVRADTDGVTPIPIVWSYPTTAGTPAMDRVTGQPYVDYCRNRLWVSTGNNAGQDSLWVLNTLDGTKVTSFADLGDQTNSSPTLSYDGTTVYVGDAAGRLYAIDAATTGTTAKYSLQLPGTSPQIAGFIWEDGTASPRRLYIPVLTNGNAGVWCVEDNGSALTACSSWSVNPRAPVAGGSPSQPLMSDTAIFYPASNGNIYQIHTADGQLVGTPFTVESGIQLGGISTEDLTQLYVGTSTGRTYRINLTNGNLP